MKIGQDLRSKVEPTKKNISSRSTSVKSFQQVVGQETQKMKESEMDRLLSQISDQGEKLAEYRTFKDLAKYKKLVRQFIQEAVQYGLELEQTRSWNASGNNRKLTLVKTIDEKLVQLTDDILDQEKKSIDILDVIGEIKGMLMNMYA
ncbi:DUF327 domain-containing protein [Halalkalibacillus sediminis]|uniref:DUF327 domain-containing protein n=1 Tax=Halalkalibacillus sediminis TaxID=2018042 RepID=A0A2I0QTR1_9BACI|nr:YaaR family protein [Halalkalibacillus sediminis]PKR77480.1 DUF327 domain-containing protein [Halalkalibacillus sediminis]